jgi:hypothetical protein
MMDAKGRNFTVRAFDPSKPMDWDLADRSFGMSDDPVIRMLGKKLMDELEASRVKVAELEGQLPREKRIGHCECNIKWIESHPIIPQEGDADIIKEILAWSDKEYYDEDISTILEELLSRYLAAIEGKA